MADERLLVSIPRHVLHTPFQLHQGLHFTRIHKPFTWPYCWPTRCLRNNTYKAFIHSHNNILISTSENKYKSSHELRRFPSSAQIRTYAAEDVELRPTIIILVKFDSKAPLKKPRNHSMGIWRGLRRFPRLTMGHGLNVVGHNAFEDTDTKEQQLYKELWRFLLLWGDSEGEEAFLPPDSSAWFCIQLQALVHRNLYYWTPDMLIRCPTYSSRESNSSSNCRLSFQIFCKFFWNINLFSWPKQIHRNHPPHFTYVYGKCCLDLPRQYHLQRQFVGWQQVPRHYLPTNTCHLSASVTLYYYNIRVTH
jgi:hypothetical protein